LLGFVYRFQTTGTIEEKIFQRQYVPCHSLLLIDEDEELISGAKNKTYPHAWSMKQKIQLVISPKMT
jgi:hypothetical protein